MLLSIKHRTIYDYETVPYRVGLRLMIFPRNFPHQKVRKWSVTVNGNEIGHQFENAYGEYEAIWLAYEPEIPIEIVAEGSVKVEDNSGVLQNLRTKTPNGIFLRHTELTNPNDDIRTLAREVPAEGTLEMAHKLSKLISERVLYLAGKTNTATTAAEALQHGAGVCQDHAHLMISVARELNVPARYVVGYLYDPEQEDKYGDSHAWAELYIDTLGWVAFDPSNQVCPTDCYVRLTSGLDAKDAAPMRGLVVGTKAEAMDVKVTVDCITQ